MTPFQIVVLPGDGIGPEVIAASLEVLRAVAARLEGVRFDLALPSVGAGAVEFPSPSTAPTGGAPATALIKIVSLETP